MRSVSVLINCFISYQWQTDILEAIEDPVLLWIYDDLDSYVCMYGQLCLSVCRPIPSLEQHMNTADTWYSLLFPLLWLPYSIICLLVLVSYFLLLFVCCPPTPCERLKPELCTQRQVALLLNRIPGLSVYILLNLQLLCLSFLVGIYIYYFPF